MSELIRCTVQDGVVHIELNRPQVANAFDLETSQVLGDVVADIEASQAVRAVLVTGSGSRFCAGGDAGAMAVAEPRADYVRRNADALDRAVHALAGLDRPTVAVVHGAVAGAGMALMLSCELVVAHPGTKFAYAYSAVGLTPDCGLSWLLPRAVGQQRALEFALTGRALGAEEARDWGLVTEVSEDAGSRGLELARMLAAGPPEVHGLAKRLVRDAWDRDRTEAGQNETAVISRMADAEFASRALQPFARR
jgi:2-(1,2-epoxy-1,2-dihydrophenyl)acetyl-CoA isomerase